jgi:hypothetical protein
VKANITIKQQAVPNHRRRKGKWVKSNIDLLMQVKPLNSWDN